MGNPDDVELDVYYTLHLTSVEVTIYIEGCSQLVHARNFKLQQSPQVLCEDSVIIMIDHEDFGRLEIEIRPTLKLEKDLFRKGQFIQTNTDPSAITFLYILRSKQLDFATRIFSAEES
jgi:hypothetical protein